MPNNLKAILFLFMFSILAPPFLNMFDLTFNEIAWVDFAEEESQKNTEKGFEENVILIHTHSGLEITCMQYGSIRFNFYLENSSNYTAKIHLPPPEIIA